LFEYVMLRRSNRKCNGVVKKKRESRYYVHSHSAKKKKYIVELPATLPTRKIHYRNPFAKPMG
ncbi:MAG: hypothetical protein ABFC85_05400, partial [Rectinema sp.]